MHRRFIWSIILSALCCVENVVGQRALRRAQSSLTTPTGTVASRISASTTTTSPALSQKPSAITSSSETTHRATTATITGNGLQTTTGLPASSDTDSHALPMQPTITPAIGIAGAILVITGLVYAAIGIKHEWLLVLLGAAYLISLSVTVLIVYLMDPPVSDAIQGVYVVAAIISGLVFGAVALLFKEITGGLGCLVGGFCLAMWFLTLKAGGLLTSTTGKAAMISLFSAASWTLSFSEYTRGYAVIFGTAFTGATAAMLGIDCFSRAGLKEFWIYIWGLNDQEFPLHTTTYPVTRGMRAENVCTIVLFLFGFVAQVKLRKHIKQRKAGEEEGRQQDETQEAERDSRFSLSALKRHTLSLSNWEAVYGDNRASFSRIESQMGTLMNSSKNPVNVTEREVDAVEMTDLEPSGSTRHYRDQSDGQYSIDATAGGDGESTTTVSNRASEDVSVQEEEEDLFGNRISIKDEGVIETIYEVPLDEDDEEELLRPCPVSAPSDQDISRDVENPQRSHEGSATEEQHRPSIVDNTQRTRKWARDSKSYLLEKMASAPTASRTTVFKRRSNTENNARRIFSTPPYSSQRHRSSTSSLPSRRALRCVSSPLMQECLVESPIEEDFNSGDTLMNQRSARMLNRPRTVNFNAVVPPSNSELGIVSGAASIRTQQDGVDEDGDGDMTLSQRRSLIQQGQIRISSSAASSDRGSIKSSARRSTSGSAVQHEPYNAQHQQRSVSLPQIHIQPPPSSSRSSILPTSTPTNAPLQGRSHPSTAQLVNWRQTLQQPPASSSKQQLLAEQITQPFPSTKPVLSNSSYPAASDPDPHMQYLSQYRQSLAEKLRYQDYQVQVQAQERQRMESRTEMAMRTGRMTEKHRDAMRKMQAVANASLGGV